MKSKTHASVRLVTSFGRAVMASAKIGQLVVISFAADVARAQNSSPSFAMADTSSPHAMLKTFIDFCNEFHRLTEADRYFDRRSPLHRPLVRGILDCLDTSELPDYARDDRASEAAACLKEILDRVALPPFDEIPDFTAIAAAGGPEKLSRWHIPDKRLTIARVEEGPGKHEYLFTLGTVERAFDRYEEMEQLDYRTTGPEVSKGFYQWYATAPGHPMVAAIDDQLPEGARQDSDHSAWQWEGLLLMLVIMVVVMGLAYRLERILAVRWRVRAVLLYGLTIVRFNLWNTGKLVTTSNIKDGNGWSKQWFNRMRSTRPITPLIADACSQTASPALIVIS